VDLTAEIKISENVLSLFGALYIFCVLINSETSNFNFLKARVCIPKLDLR